MEVKQNGRLWTVAAVLLASACIVLGSASFGDAEVAYAAEITEMKAAQEGDFEYVALDDGTAEITKYNGNGGAVTVPSTIGGKQVTGIGEKAFYACSSLTEIVLPEGVVSIGRSAFDECENLKGIALPEKLTAIGYWAFDQCSSLTGITLPKGMTSIGEGTFSNCESLTEIDLPEGVTSIGEFSFSGCTSLTKITLPEGLTSIGEDAFWYCSGLTEIGDGAFADCSSLTEIQVGLGNQKYTSQSGILYDKELTVLIFYPTGKDGKITLPDSITGIGNGAFYCCSNLTEIDLPDSVTSIGDGAFNDCINLTKITLPKGLTRIGDFTFYGCKNMTEITLPEGLTDIGYAAFYACKNLKDVYYAGSESQWSEITIGGDNSGLNKATIHCNSNASISTPAKGEIIPLGNYRYKITKKDSSVAFAGCSGKVSVVTIPPAVMIGGVKYKVTSIAAGAMKGDTKVKSITIGKNVVSIGSKAFSGCKKLSTITLKTTGLKSVGAKALKGIAVKAKIKVPAKKLTVYGKLFKGKGQGSKVTITKL